MNRFLFTSLAAGLVIASALGAQTPPVVPDLVLRNGHIFTGDKTDPWVEAISIRDERIAVLAGSDATVTATAGAQTKVIDLQGRMAMPGINDSHDHVGGAGFGVQLHFPPGKGPHGPGPEPVGRGTRGCRKGRSTDRTTSWLDRGKGRRSNHPAPPRDSAGA